MFSFGAAAHVADRPDVLLLEAALIVENSDAVSLYHKGERWNKTRLCWITVVISVLRKGQQIKTESVAVCLFVWVSVTLKT